MARLDDWPRIKRVLEGALARDGDEQRAYVTEACGNDAECRAQVERLLAVRDDAGAFLEIPAAALLLDEPRFPDDLSGRVVSTYRLVSRLGVGGMGEVYLAHDMKLDRRVALKVMSPALAADRDRLRRFHHEARAASSLNHPHIVVVHDFGELDGRPYIVTEFIEGETLRARMIPGPIPLNDVLAIGVQVADALGAAHARGVVHRDIKPENIMVRPDGYAKVLDFGVAKIAPRAYASDRDGSDYRTRPGSVIGTPLYMSPEQARGLDLDARTDVWSLGVVLHEMATGRLPFLTDGSVMPPGDEQRVDPAASPPDRAHRHVPPELVGIIGKALRTVPDQRYEHAADLCADLRQVPRATDSNRRDEPGRLTRRPARRLSRALWLGAALAMLVGSLATVPWMHGTRAPDVTSVALSVAVLPFDNIGGTRDIDYLRLALADEIATALSAAPPLAVRPTSSSRRFLDGGVSAQEAGRQLRASSVIIGHFSIQQSELHVTVEAVDVDGNRLLWRDSVAAPSHDAIALRDRLTSRLRDGLLPALGVAAPAPARARPQNAEAYALYLKSLALSSDPQPNREAIAMLQRASAIDPDYADTWVQLAQRYYTDGHYSGGGREALRRSETAARQALRLDPSRTPATARLLNLQVEAGRLQDAYDSAIKLVAQRPESGEARFTLSYVLRYGGLLEESARECEQAVARDPTNPLLRSCAQPFMLIGQYDRALDFVRLDADSEWGAGGCADRLSADGQTRCRARAARAIGTRVLPPARPRELSCVDHAMSLGCGSDIPGTVERGRCPDLSDHP
jgi:serine/threonine protein kinase